MFRTAMSRKRCAAELAAGQLTLPSLLIGQSQPTTPLMDDLGTAGDDELSSNPTIFDADSTDEEVFYEMLRQRADAAPESDYQHDPLMESAPVSH